ncbi:hypothetical protein GCM10008927_17350 [Amylibacter ulvae]|uniref:Glycerophosphoryl diester phosphodiesterase membrane domain-containing protein n=1 Tax=Paramylibacter ulvae TaxID=1651968 RepID=A0ABQ3D6E0_9RHOB|nr:hypothetical protein [Amylibacter ulvae]GHA52432.1 hypothetical protein GCM10008927_17350 [Amylibacter ulvae]
METGIVFFKKAIAMVGDNINDAVRVSAVIYIVQFVIVTALMVSITGGFDAAQLQDPAQMAQRAGGATISALLIVVVTILSLSWIAVAWHRFVLLEEYAQGVVPAWNRARVMAYIWKSILLGLLIIGIAIIPMMIVGMLAAVSPILSGLGMIALFAGIIWLSTRLAMVLPATAIGSEMTFAQAWKHTESRSKDIFVAAVLMSLIFSITGQVLQSFLPVNVIGAVVMGAFQWVATMVGLSLITTIYGACVEGREIA